MRLQRLAIRALPGIEPGFVFEPPGPGINLVTGPNAIGKSSLVRALRYLLASERSDPLALSLEAEFESGGIRWQVQRNGGQIVWRRNGEVAPRPPLPAADQIGRYRLSIENLLDDDDASDRELAVRLRRELHGNFDLGALRPSLGPRFARREANALDEARRARREVERDYAALVRHESELSGLERRVEEARAAEERCAHLKRALELADAADARTGCEAALGTFPPDMERLRGDELGRLEDAEHRLRELGDELRERRRARAEAEAALEGTGLARARPTAEAMQAVAAKLRTLDQLHADRRTARELLERAQAEMQDALAAFNEAGVPPRLEAGVFRRVEEFAPLLIAARIRRRELREQLSLAGEAPEESEVERQRDGVEALRAWLAVDAAEAMRARGTGRLQRVVAGVALAASALAAVAAFLQGAVVVLTGALVAAIASGFALFLQRGPQGALLSPKDEAARRFRATGLETPVRWEEESVRRHLREKVEAPFYELRLRRQRAAGRDRIVLQIGETETAIEALERERAALAAECAFDPCLPVAEFHRFVHMCSRWDEARRRHAEHEATLALLDGESASGAEVVRDALSPWRARDQAQAGGAPERTDRDVLQSAFDALQERIRAADDVLSEIRNCDTAVEALNQRIADLDRDVGSLFEQAGLAPGERAELERRIARLPRWKEAREALDAARTGEGLIGGGLAEHPDLIALAQEGRRAELRGEHDALARRAAEHTALIEQRTEIQTRLDDAGRGLALEQAAARESAAEQALSDKREEALFAVATETLLEDLEREFVAEHEPAVLRRAREIFAQVTARAFDLGLRPDGSFFARDERQGAERELAELSSGTRAQLLLALRLAWTEAQEQGGESLPLFLDEALTTSDEERFVVMARSLERVAGAEGRERQVFYLSARRHERALWERATGTEPATLDLAAVRFPGQVSAPEAYRIEAPPSFPEPGGQSAEEYASDIGVPRLDPHRPPGEVHLFHLLRDDLPALHALMDTWRISAVGQLEALLASDAAPIALPGDALRRRLRLRCRALRVWTDLWREGRGRPVDRGVLEQSGAVSAGFIDRAAELAAGLGGDGEALLRSLRAGEIALFQRRMADRLEHFLVDEGYIDPRSPLEGDERRRLSVQRAAPETPDDARDLHRMLDWLEGAVCGDGEQDHPGDANAPSTAEAP